MARHCRDFQHSFWRIALGVAAEVGVRSMRFLSFVSWPWWHHAWLALFVKSGAYALVGLGFVALIVASCLTAIAWAIREIDKQTGL
jgi:hypothetical protein